MKRYWKIGLFLFLPIGLVVGWLLLGPATGFDTKTKYLYIRSDAATEAAVMDSIQANKIISNQGTFRFLARRMGYWQSVKPGKYEVAKGTSVLSLLRMLRNGRQSPVDLVIVKFRTKEELARLAGAKFEFGSDALLSFFNNPDTMRRYGVDTSTVFCNILPDTYRFFWSTTPSAVYHKLQAEAQEFWTPDRKRKAAALGLSTNEVYTLASIIEEETTNHEEKDTVASVYLNRLKKGMPLQADPTLKFAVRNFGLKRIAGDLLDVSSPYNTYRNRGLPPGPICTPSKITLEAVLEPAQTAYYYFVANSRLNGHLFSETFEEHRRKANQYRTEDKSRRERDSLRKLSVH